MIEIKTANQSEESIIINYPKPALSGFLQEDDGNITINKTVQKEGKEKKVTETFYFGLFGEESLTNYIYLASAKLQNEAYGTVALENLPYGTYFIAETDEEGIPVDEAFAYEVTIDKEIAVITEDNKSAVIEIVNSEIVSTDETEDETTEITKKRKRRPSLKRAGAKQVICHNLCCS